MRKQVASCSTAAILPWSAAVADWLILNASVNTAVCASWVSVHNSGSVSIGYSQHEGMVVVADDIESAAQRLRCGQTTDPGLGIIRHVDAGYDKALEETREHGIKVPMRE